MVTAPVISGDRSPRVLIGAALKRNESGFTYLAMLFAIVVIGIALAVTGQVWSTAAQRERETELIYRGNEIRKAIGSYYETSPGAKVYPSSIEDLVKDGRFPAAKRHLRRFYDDPFTGKPDWELIKAGNGIMGVKSASGKEPLKTAGFEDELAALNGKTKYNEWEFIYVPAQSVARPSQNKPPMAPAPK